MERFGIFFGLGLEHLTDLNGYDHMLFLATLVAGYRLRDWRAVAWLVTAFTLGHSLSLALATLGVVRVSSAWIEFLIPVSIVATAALNLSRAGHETTRREQQIAYALAAGFGLIHGLGFSNYLQALLGRQAEILLPLFAFNLGLEVGQLAVVGLLLGVAWVVMDVLKAPRRPWTLGLSLAAGLLALWLAVERWPL